MDLTHVLLTEMQGWVGDLQYVILDRGNRAESSGKDALLGIQAS